MSGFTIKPNEFSKVTGYIDGVTLTDEDDYVAAILKVSKEGYVPEGVNLRKQIDDTLFTADVNLQTLKSLEDDSNVSSVAIAKDLSLIK